jgi:protoheme IX farnesyltransferase
MIAAGTLALNQYIERDVDAKMHRTRNRPLPDGRLHPVDALVFGTVLTVAGLLYLTLAVNALSGAVTAITTVSYLFVYTPMKLRTPLCSLVGAVPGALPPVTGWDTRSSIRRRSIRTCSASRTRSPAAACCSSGSSRR